MQYVFIFLLLAKIAACHSIKERSQPSTLFTENWSILMVGRDCAIEERQNLIVKTQNDFDGIWAAMYSDHPDRPQKPQINFSKHWLIASFLGTVNSAGHSLSLHQVKKQDAKMIIELAHHKPAPGCLTAQVIESPFVLALMEHYEAATNFSTKIVEEKCD